MEKRTDNELIAEFMGLIRKEPTKEYNEVRYVKRQGVSFKFMGYIWQLKYHSSWDWLMPVVEKIESLDNDNWHGKVNFIVDIQGLYCVISENGENPIKECQRFETKIENVFYTVVEFIKWYNSQNS